MPSWCASPEWLLPAATAAPCTPLHGPTCQTRRSRIWGWLNRPPWGAGPVIGLIPPWRNRAETCNVMASSSMTTSGLAGGNSAYDTYTSALVPQRHAVKRRVITTTEKWMTWRRAASTGLLRELRREMKRSTAALGSPFARPFRSPITTGCRMGRSGPGAPGG